MTAPVVSRSFYRALSMLGIWSLFVGVFKLYARIVPPSRNIMLDGIDGGPKRPYLRRWHLIPRNRFFNIYLHSFVRGDDERALHDHPWASASLILEGRYRELTSEWVYDMSHPDNWNLPLDEAKLNMRNSSLFDLFTPTDGRTYIEGSLNGNNGKFPGQLKFDYYQDFEAGDFRRLRPEHMHLLELFGDNDEPCWTLFVTGPIVRRWGFACGGDEGWRDFRRYTADHPTRANATVGCE